MKKFTILLLLSSAIIYFACDNDSGTGPTETPIPLKADAGPSRQVYILQQVTLDGTKSTGPSGFTYEWTYSGNVPEQEINFQGKNTAQPTFIPPENDTYLFTLTVSSDGKSDVDQVAITTEGAAEIGGTLTENLQLVNIQPDDDLPDYIVTSDLIVGDGIVLSVMDRDVRIQFNSGAGLHIKSGGHFTNIDSKPIK